MIGEIASKIGQLYYNYYSRKSDTGALQEAYSFYDAIRSRQYFHGAEDNRSSLQQQLRYHARFLLVCLLLQEIDKVRSQPGRMRMHAYKAQSSMIELAKSELESALWSLHLYDKGRCRPCVQASLVAAEMQLYWMVSAA